MNVQCNSFILHREALHAQLRMDRFRFVNQYQKFVTKRGILCLEDQSGKRISRFKAVFNWYLHVRCDYFAEVDNETQDSCLTTLKAHATMPVVKMIQFSGIVVKAKICFASFPEFFDEAGQ